MKQFICVQRKKRKNYSFLKQTLQKNNLKRLGSVWPEHLPQVTSEPKPISKLKYPDLKTALKRVPRMFHNFYKNMKCDDKIADYPG